MTDRPPSRSRKRPASLTSCRSRGTRRCAGSTRGRCCSTGKLVALSSVFGTYADKREMQATAPTEPFHDHSGPEDIWVDYVSDLGDGFDATYTLAYLLAQPKLDVTVHDGQDTVPTPAGRCSCWAATRSTRRRRPAPTRSGPKVRTTRRCRTPTTRLRCSRSRATTTGTTGSPRSCGSSARAAGSAAGRPSSAAATSR